MSIHGSLVTTPQYLNTVTSTDCFSVSGQSYYVRPFTLNGKLYAKAGGSTSNLVSWDGTTAVTNLTIPGTSMFDSVLWRGDIYMTVGSPGSTYLAKYNGSTYTYIYTGAAGSPYGICVHDDKIYFATSSDATKLRSWDGTTLTAVTVDALVVNVNGVCSYGGYLYTFCACSDGTMRVFKYDGTTFTLVGSLTSTSSYIDSKVYNGKMYFFVRTAGGDAYVGSYDGTTFTTSIKAFGTGSSGYQMFLHPNGTLQVLVAVGTTLKGTVWAYNGTSWSIYLKSTAVNGTNAKSVTGACVFNGNVHYSFYVSGGQGGVMKITDSVVPVTGTLNFPVHEVNGHTTHYYQIAEWKLTGNYGTFSSHITLQTVAKDCLLEMYIRCALNSTGDAFGSASFKIKDVFVGLGNSVFRLIVDTDDLTAKLVMTDSTDWEPHRIMRIDNMMPNATFRLMNVNWGAGTLAGTTIVTPTVT